MTSIVDAVHADHEHRFSKQPQRVISLLQGMGVEGDAHAGVTVQHRSRVARDPSQPNLRQVHLIGIEVLDELGVAPGQLGENLTTRGLDLHALPVGATLNVGDEAVIALTGLRNPCRQIDNFRDGLLKQVLTREPDGEVRRRAGVMAVVIRGGLVRPGDPIRPELPDGPHRRLEVV